MSSDCRCRSTRLHRWPDTWRSADRWPPARSMSTNGDAGVLLSSSSSSNHSSLSDRDPAAATRSAISVSDDADSSSPAGGSVATSGTSTRRPTARNLSFSPVEISLARRSPPADIVMMTSGSAKCRPSSRATFDARRSDNLRLWESRPVREANPITWIRIGLSNAGSASCWRTSATSAAMPRRWASVSSALSIAKLPRFHRVIRLTPASLRTTFGAIAVSTERRSNSCSSRCSPATGLFHSTSSTDSDGHDSSVCQWPSSSHSVSMESSSHVSSTTLTPVSCVRSTTTAPTRAGRWSPESAAAGTHRWPLRP